VFEIGKSLRDARTRQGLEVTDLEGETKIRAKYLRALEAEEFDQLPGESYVRGFLRLYAERLGLDGQLYVDEYNARFSGTDEPVFAARTRRRAQAHRTESRAVLVALAGIIVVTALVIAAWRFGTGSAEEGGPAVVAPAETSAETVEQDTGTVPITAVTLVVTAVGGSSRLEVREGSGAGELLFEGTLRKGETSPPFVGEELWIEVTRPQQLAFAIDGFPVDRPRVTGPSALVASADGLRVAEAP
jgi:hypothetical protein